MQRIYHTKFKSKGLLTIFKCTECGKVTVTTQEFVNASTYQGSLTTLGDKKAESKADKRLNDWSKLLAESVNEDIEYKDFENTGFTCACNHCGAVPLWSNFKDKKLEGLKDWTNVLFLLSLIITISAIAFSHAFLWTILPAALLIARIAIGIFIKFVYRKKRFNVCQLDDEYMPKICRYKEDLDDILASFGVTSEEVFGKNE